jgi:hypothetical protein
MPGGPLWPRVGISGGRRTSSGTTRDDRRKENAERVSSPNATAARVSNNHASNNYEERRKIVKVRRKIFGPVVMGAALGLAGLATQALGAAPAEAASIPPGSVQVVAKSSPVNNLASKLPFRANCPPGQRVLGGGAFTVGGVHAVITELQPIHTTGGDSFEVDAAADQFGIPVAWNFQVFAFCASVPDALGVEIIQHTNAPTSGGTDQAGTQCPAGKQLIGAGGKIANGNGQVDLGITTNSSGPFAFGSAAFAKEDADGFAGSYTVTGYSVCARGNAFGDFQQFKTQFSTTAASQTETVACPSGLRLTGLAGATELPGTHLQEIAPHTTNGPILADFSAQSSIPPGEPWTMETTVFCAK